MHLLGSKKPEGMSDRLLNKIKKCLDEDKCVDAKTAAIAQEKSHVGLALWLKSMETSEMIAELKRRGAVSVVF